jgi:pimeloyl-ACP methyl ester carboxylesterase
MDMINAARAAASLKELNAGKKTIVYGWSQGGGAVIAATSLPQYLARQGTAADNLQLIGGVALAPQDVAIVMPGATANEAIAQKSLINTLGMFTDNVFNFTHMAMGMWGTQAANPQLKMSDLFTDDGVKVLNEVFSNKCMHAGADTLNFNYGANYKSLLKDQPDNSLEWTKAMIQASVNPVPPVAPVVIYWGTKDTTNPPVMGKLYQEQMCKLGGNVNRVQLPGEQSHFTTPGSSKPFYIQWIKDRLAGKPAENNCAIAATLGS